MSTRSERTQLRGTRREVDLIWRTLLANPDQDDWRYAVFDSIVEPTEEQDRERHCCRRSAEQISSNGKLGLSTRLIVIRDSLGWEKGSFFQKVLTRYKESSVTGHRIGWTSPSELDRLFQLGNDKGNKRELDRETEQTIVDWLNEQVRANLQPIGVEEVFYSSHEGPNAVSDYAASLTGGSRRLDPGLGLMGPQRTFFTQPGSGREKCIAKLKAAVVTQDDKTAAPPMFVNAYALGMWHGLTACAHRLIDEILSEADAPPLLYIPLMRHGDTPRDPRQKPAAFQALNFAQVVGYLRAFFESEPLESARPIRDADGLFDVVQAIRLRMCETPAIVIFDGYIEHSGNRSSLERFIMDDLLVSLLNRLLEPPISNVDNAHALRKFRRNRIVVFSNYKVSQINSFLLGGGQAGSPFIEIPPPSETHFDEVLEQQVFDNLEDVKTLRSNIGALRASRSEALFYMVDSIVSVEKRITGEQWSLQDLRTELSNHLASQGDEGVMARTATFLLLRMRDHLPSWYEFLMFLAAAPDGLRKGTITRIMEAAKTCQPPGVTYFQSFCEEEDPERFIAEVLSTCRAFLACGRSDYFEGLDEFPHPLEISMTDEAEGAPPSNEETWSIDFAVPEIRDAILAQEAMQLPKTQFHLMHRLLAEESIKQQTIALRHHDVTVMQSIRPFRRLLSAIYNGLQALPIDQDRQFSSIAFQSPNFSAPAEPIELWKWLYLFCYRRIVERPPAWNLSRYYGLDELKVDLLTFFDRPWRLWPDGMLRPRPKDGSRRGLIDKDFGGKAGLEIAREHFFSVAQANYAIGDADKARAALSDAQGLGLDSSGVATLRALKKSIDIDLGQEIERIVVDDIEANLAALTGKRFEKIKNHVETVKTEMIELVNSNANFNAAVKISSPEDALDDLSQHASSQGWASKDVSDISDVIFRIAEVIATYTDLDSSNALLAAMEEADGNRAILPESIMTDAEVESFCLSLSWSRFAEALRLRNFSLHPTGSHFFASGHAARHMIRVALKLELIAREKLPPDESQTVGAGYFAHTARFTADVMTRHLFRYPRERASMLIIEATMLRLLAPPAKRRIYLMCAREYLKRAEAIVLGLGNSARVRMRLCLERAKLSRSIALSLHDDNEPDYEHYLDLCRFDVDLLQHLAEASGVELWITLAKLQRIKYHQVLVRKALSSRRQSNHSAD